MCKAARELHATVGALILDEVKKLPGDGSRRKFWELMRDSIAKRLPQEPGRPAALENRPKACRATSDSYEEAIELIETIRELADSICENGQDFAASVLEKAESICESVERAGSATDGQLGALENMQGGLERWFHD